MRYWIAILFITCAFVIGWAGLTAAQQANGPTGADPDEAGSLVDPGSRTRHRRDDPFLQYAKNVEVRINQLEIGDFPIVRAFVNVADENDIQIRSLVPADFTVEENGIAVDEILFANRDELNLPLSIMLVLDISGSMDVVVDPDTEATALDVAKRAIHEFTAQLAPRDRIGLITFSDAALNEVRLTTNHADLLQRLDRLSAWGQTTLWDAILLGMEDLIADPQPARRALIVLSDGLDNHSLETPVTLLQWFEDEALDQNLGFSVYSLGLGNEIDRGALNNIAARTGGLYFDSPTAADLSGLYQDILRQIQNEYLLEWRSPGPTQPGQIIDVSIGITPVQTFTPGRYTYRSPGLSAALARAIWPGLITISALIIILIIATIFKASRKTWLTVMITALEGKDYSVGSAGLDIGTMESCELRQPHDPAMLPVHASLRESADGFVLAVMDPQAPIILDGKLLARKLLRTGDRFTLGTTKFVFNERVIRPGEGQAVLAEHIVDLQPAEQLTEEAQLASPSGSATAPRITPSSISATTGPHAGQRFNLKEGDNIIGRRDCPIALSNDSRVSRRHCIVTLSGGTASLVDPGSTNGTRVNGVPCQTGMALVVYSGDVLGIGSGDYTLE